MATFAPTMPYKSSDQSDKESVRRQTEAERCLEEIIRRSEATRPRRWQRKSSPDARVTSRRAGSTVGAHLRSGAGRFGKSLSRWGQQLGQRLKRHGRELWLLLRDLLRPLHNSAVTHYYLPLLMLGVLLGLVTKPSSSESAAPREVVLPETGAYVITPTERPYRYIGSFRRDFDDLNAIQLEAARAVGITPVNQRSDLAAMSDLIPLSESSYLAIDHLTHSQPVLVPEAARLVTEIGAAFTGQLQADGQPLYRLIVTSVTRTDEDMRALRQSNGNASHNSTHCYGTTVDISWQRYDKVDPADEREIAPEELKHLLAMVLRSFHEEGRCYIKHERRQACFHITVRPSE